MKIYKWGILGCGNIAISFIEALRTASNAELLAVASTSLERAGNYANKYQIPLAYGSYQDLVENPGIDAVYIANSHNFHKDSALLCLEHGKAVLCEKPITVNADQFKKLTEKARSNNVFLMEAMWTRFLPTIQKIKELLDEQTIGEVRLVTADFGFKTDKGPESRILNPALAGGALLDVGIYPVMLASLAFNKYPVEIKSLVQFSETGVDESSSYLLKYDDGGSALLSASVSFVTSRTATIVGTKGFITLPSFWKAESMTVHTENRPPVEYSFPFRCNGYEYEIEEVISCLENGMIESKRMSWDQSLNVLNILDEIRRQWNLTYPGE